MTFRELTILLPCHSLEDFPLYHTGKDADSLLACWTALWHPVLMVAANSTPKWHRVDLPPDDVGEKLILIPTISQAQVQPAFTQQAKEGGSLVIRGEHDRSKIVMKALERLEPSASSIDPELVADFFALGYGYLQVQVLTRQMRYASHLDEVQFFGHVMSAAKAAVSGDGAEAVSKITACFNMLGEERDHYYSVDAYLIDLVLTTDDTLGIALRRELSGKHAINLLLSGQTARRMKLDEPETLAIAQTALAESRLGIVGGESTERRLPLLACEDLLEGLLKGEAAIQEAFERRPEVFGRRLFGLSPCLPGILEKLRYRGAIHATFDDGQFPSGSQVKTRWQGVDSGVIDAIAKPPLDASKPETFLSYAQRLGESMDTDHVATLCLAHWPGHVSPWFDDLRRCTRYTSALGRFITVERYFMDTYLPGHLDRFEIDQYKSPYLRQDVIRKRVDPISSYVKYWRYQTSIDALESLANLTAVVGNRVATSDVSSEFVRSSELAYSEEPETAEWRARIDEELKRFAATLPRSGAPAADGYLVANPLSFVRRVGVDVSKLKQLPAVEKPVVMADECQGRKLAVVEVPPRGFAWISAGTNPTTRKKSEPVLTEDARSRADFVYLRNEFMEAAIDPVTGALRSLMDYRARGNRLSQQLALRMPASRGAVGEAWRDPDENARYSVMVADEITLEVSSTVLGQVVSRGRLLDLEGQVVAKFEQTWRLWRGSRVLESEVELEPLTLPTSDPWNSYYASRLAWPDETAELFCAVNQTRQPITKKRIESPWYVDVVSGGSRVTILSGGLPYHRRVGSRKLDSILIVRGEKVTRFSFGIGLDLPYPWAEATSLLSPVCSTFESASPPSPRYSWLFHIDNRSVMATHWSTLLSDGKPAGVRIRLLENSGRTGQVRISCYRPFVSARQVNFLGEILSELKVIDGKVTLDIGASEWIEVEARWS